MDPVQLTLVVMLFATAFGAVLAGIPVAFALSGSALLMAFGASRFGLFDLAFLGAIPSRIYGVAIYNEVLTAVPLFILMGVILERSRVAEDLLDSMARVFARVPAGLGISVTFVGVLLAASTGIVGATVIAMGLLSLPTMLRRGYDPALASGSICAAGTLGQIIPPSIVLVFLSDQLSAAYMEAQREIGNFSPVPVSVGDLFAGALIPGLGLAALYMVYQFIVGLLRPDLCPPPAEEERRSVEWRDVIFSLAAPVLLILTVLGSILTGAATPTEAAGVGALGALLLAARKLNKPDIAESPWQDRVTALLGLLVSAGIIAAFALPVLRELGDLRMTLKHVSAFNAAMFSFAVACTALLALGVVVSIVTLARRAVLNEVLISTMRITTLAFVILIGATIFSLVFRGFGGDEIVTHAFDHIPGGVNGALLAVLVVVFVLGFFLDFIEIVFIIMPIVAPVILRSGIDPVWFGILIAMNLQTSFLTPPFGFALFYLKGVAPKVITTAHIYRGVLPFIAIQIVALILVFLFPELATWLPSRISG
ncbi:MAG: TRAP transporter large permease subunit [Rhodobiaceae bacterium]|nr:TRAP transporter large permease subunit [Rhodobiaceae bacterium]MCC0049869.1 TRAP transporter large permease subunit [Rhodobiaceae bacterium]